jgi:hypothetical protein
MRIRDLGWKKIGSGINIPDPQHCLVGNILNYMRYVLASPRWVTVDKSGEMQYRIVAPMLSSSGDYTPVYALIATSKVSNRVPDPGSGVFFTLDPEAFFL